MRIWIHLKLSSLFKRAIFSFPWKLTFVGFSEFIGILTWFTKFSSPPWHLHSSPIREGGHQVASAFWIPKYQQQSTRWNHQTFQWMYSPILAVCEAYVRESPKKTLWGTVPAFVVPETFGEKRALLIYVYKTKNENSYLYMYAWWLSPISTNFSGKKNYEFLSLFLRFACCFGKRRAWGRCGIQNMIM